MSETYSKNYFEKYAALTLTKILDIKEYNIIQSDKPDLRIPILDFGIEVTQAITQEEAVADMKKPLYASLDMTPFDHNSDSIPYVLEKVHNAIERKIIKSKNYDQYLYNGLYIFSHCHNMDTLELNKYFQSLNYRQFFYRYVFINCVTQVYCFDYKAKKLTSTSFHKNELISMNIHSLIYDRNCSKKRRKIILPKT